ncbi:MAG: cysteine--tRNA ligase [Oscillospiraceae bacterium]|jgi:cysteinyl-tRNA synthetase|nr:cysteine--tRNA ligase [Oscillospiraceae bacterium]
MKIFNTRSRVKEDFVPLTPGQVRMYACGPTVYNYFHIGNARAFITFDTLRRYLEFRGLKVTFVQNLTDIDDKMIRRANEEGITVAELAERFIKIYHEDAAKLGVRPATFHPRATEHMPEIIALVQTLVNKGHAYAAEGDVYFDTQSFPHYGCLCGQNLDDLESGARVDIDERKRHPMDFALWKSKKPGEPSWESPWGAGRPGWHIECSAMAMKYLGETFDIHGGGSDLIFPHHENELAQSEAATGKPFARYWMHNGMLNIDNQKMSKSLGNFMLFHDIIKEVDPEAVRLFLLSAQYRSPLNYSQEQLKQAQSTLTRLYAARARSLFLLDHAPTDAQPGDAAATAEIDAARNQFITAMDDDMNTADALAALFELVRIVNVSLNDAGKTAIQHWFDVFASLTGVLGLVAKPAESGIPEDVQALLDARAAARKAKQWQESDRLRTELKAKGYAVEDTPQGQKLNPI